jgi:hypothetical protein
MFALDDIWDMFKWEGNYGIFFPDYSVLKPDRPASHKTPHHDVCEHSVTDDDNLISIGDFRRCLIEKVVYDCLMTARFLISAVS